MNTMPSEGSVSSSSSSEDVDYPDTMTEEEAMAIWLRRNREHEERRLRREQRIAAFALRNPSPHDTTLGYQRFRSLFQPGMAEGYVASSPGLARFLEQERCKTDEERHHDMLIAAAEEQQEQLMNGFREGGQPMQRDHVGIQVNAYTPPSMMSPQQQQTRPREGMYGIPETAFAAQQREYERLRQAHLQRIAHEDTAPITLGQQNFAPDPHHHHDPQSRRSLPEMTGNSEDEEKEKQSRGEAKNGPRPQAYYLATPSRTQWYTKPVTCQHCTLDLFTHPLSKRYYCQPCGSFSNIEDRDMGSCWEEKMQDSEDEDFDICMSTY